MINSGTTTLTFHGGAGEVTGANILIEFETQKVLVDCGLHQGESFNTDEKNREPFAYNVAGVHALFITHAHADHIGRVPFIVKHGFHGVIYSTQETRSLAELVLKDALHIFKDHEQRFNTKPLYEQADLEHALSLWKTVSFHEEITVGDGVKAHYTPIGHILGAGAVHFTRNGRKLVCTGDIGNTPDVLLPEPETLDGATYIVMESVYGDRQHIDRDNRQEILARLIRETAEKHRTLIIPSFAVHRTQSILFEIHQMVHDGIVPAIPVYLDSPLAISATDVYRHAVHLFKDEVKHAGANLFDFPKLTIVKHGRESARINDIPGAKIILAGSGMSVGGRIVSHEQALLSDKNTTILFVGYQAPGSLGRRIQDGQPKIKIGESWIHVKAKIETIHGYSGHADRDGLLDVVEKAGESVKKVFVIMGEPKAAQFFAQRVHDFLALETAVPKEHESFQIDF
jgi:metallo-beta-lactamase family protein